MNAKYVGLGPEPRCLALLVCTHVFSNQIHASENQPAERTPLPALSTAAVALFAAGAAACAVATYAAVYYADKHGLHRYEGSDDGDWRHRHLSSPSPSDTPTTTELQA